MEVWNAYDINRQKLPHLLVRDQPIPDGQFHLCVNVFVRHSDGDFLFMHRSPKKRQYPNYYELGAGGSVLAEEDSYNAALRELQEETGLVPTSIQLVNQETLLEEQCHFDYYEAIVDGDKTDITYQIGETDGHIWVSLEKLEEFIENYDVFNDQKKWLKLMIEDNLKL